MHVCLVATGFSDYSVEAASALAARCRVTLIADANHISRDSDQEKVQAFAQAGELHLFRQHRLPFRLAACVSVLSQIIRARPDAVILHEHAHPHLSWLHRQISRVAPTLLIVHDPMPHTGNDSVLASRNRHAIEIERSHASAFLLHGEYCQNLLRQQMPDDPRPMLIIPHGPILHPHTEPAHSQGKRILMFGRMEAYKGLDILLEAARLLAQRAPEIELRLAGNGPELDRLETKFIELGTTSIYKGFVPRDLALQEFSDCALVVAPYSEATQSGVVAAAFANGRPVVASRVGGLPDFITDGSDGTLVTPGDPEALANALMTLTLDPATLTRMSINATHKIMNEMSWDRFAAIVLSLLKSREPN
jgi:glycosyltransferase involved in cell wall biosynthesis